MGGGELVDPLGGGGEGDTVSGLAGPHCQADCQVRLAGAGRYQRFSAGSLVFLHVRTLIRLLQGGSAQAAKFVDVAGGGAEEEIGLCWAVDGVEGVETISPFAAA